MFYNSKKLIDEKVLQQYFFEQFMLADSSQRSNLLPKKYRNIFSNTASIKGLNPEVEIGVTSKGTKHITDFILYPVNKKNPTVNIEIKWNANDFEKQIERFEFYDGTKGQGYIVAMGNGNNHEYILDKNGQPTNIPVVYIKQEDFKNWFSKNAYDVVSQALSIKLNTKPNRITGIKYWVIVIVNASLNHYQKHGRVKGIWAFKDRSNPKEIMKILAEDYVIFVNLSCNPARMIFPMHRNQNFQPGINSQVKSKDISWHLNFVDIAKVSNGYHLNFEDKPPYDGFDEDWMTQNPRKPEEKDYTQFIRFAFDKYDKFQLFWNKNSNVKVYRKYFHESNEGHVEFCDAVRDSLCVQGDAREISKTTFDSILQILNKI